MAAAEHRASGRTRRRRLLDQARNEQSRRRREDQVSVATPQAELLNPAVDAGPGTGRDGSLARYWERGV